MEIHPDLIPNLMCVFRGTIIFPTSSTLLWLKNVDPIAGLLEEFKKFVESSSLRTRFRNVTKDYAEGFSYVCWITDLFVFNIENNITGSSGFKELPYLPRQNLPNGFTTVSRCLSFAIRLAS